MKKSILAIVMTIIIAALGASMLMACGSSVPDDAKAKPAENVSKTETAGKDEAAMETEATEKDEAPMETEATGETEESVKIETPVNAAADLKESQQEISFSAEIVDDMEIITPYYTLTTPVRWMGAYTTETVTNDTDMWLKLLYRGSEFDGHLFSILLTNKEEYETFPSFDLLGELEDTAGNKYHVVAVYPTDVQFSEKDKDNYMAMFQEKEAVLDAIQAADGCVYVKK